MDDVLASMLELEELVAVGAAVVMSAVCATVLTVTETLSISVAHTRGILGAFVGALVSATVVVTVTEVLSTVTKPEVGLGAFVGALVSPTVSTVTEAVSTVTKPEVGLTSRVSTKALSLSKEGTHSKVASTRGGPHIQ